MTLRIDVNEERFARLNDDGTVDFPRAVTTTSEDGLVTTVTSKSEAQLNEAGYEEYLIVTEGRGRPGVQPTIVWKRINDRLCKVITWPK